MKKFIINPGFLKLSDLREIFEFDNIEYSLSQAAKEEVSNSHLCIMRLSTEDKQIYGVNTGFGKLANQKISKKDLSKLQHNLILSHCTGVGDHLDNDTVRLITILKVSSLARGYSGVRYEVLQALLTLINKGCYPCIPSKGSVGASGDLAPLAHLAAPLIGAGKVRYHDEIVSATRALEICGLNKLDLMPLEGLSLVNGTQVSTALALIGLFKIEDIFAAALVSGALTVDALKASDCPFDERIHQLRGHAGQLIVAKNLTALLLDSKIKQSHKNCSKVQDPYSVRCQPQVMGACLDQISFVAKTLEIESNAITNNPIVLHESSDVLSGGNFHAEPVGFAADLLAMVVTEIASLSERRSSLMLDPNFSFLPTFLVNNSGLNSGFMIAHVTAAALVSENKSRCFPCTVDSIPTSGNQEDHVSMATHAALRLSSMVENTYYVVAIEMLLACQSLDFHMPLSTSLKLNDVYQDIRKFVNHYDEDRYLADDLEATKKYLQLKPFHQLLETVCLPSYLSNARDKNSAEVNNENIK